MKSRFDFRPKLLAVLENYSKEKFMADLMAGVIVLSLLGLLFNLFLQWLERKAIPWKN